MYRKFLRLAMCILLAATLLTAPIGATAAASNQVVRILKVTADGARVRQGPSSAYGVITSIRKGESVFYLNRNKEAFCYVRTANGQIGYMYKGFLKPYGAAKLDQIYWARTGGVHVYKKNRTSAGRVTTLTNKQHVIVYATQGNWAYVKTLSGQGGFVQLHQLQKAV